MHRWKDAPEEVSFLKNYHRHMFHIRFEVEVTEEDREIEFIMLKRELDRVVHILFVGTKHEASCEFFAKWIVDFMTRKNALCEGRAARCEVSEDGENGAAVEITKEGQFV